MSSDRVDLLRAELAVAELEDKLVAVKNDPAASPDDLRVAKEALRAARVKHRTMRASTSAEVSVGDAVVRPTTVKASAATHSPGGK